MPKSRLRYCGHAALEVAPSLDGRWLVTRMNCVQTTRWIEVPLGTVVVLGQGHVI